MTTDGANLIDAAENWERRCYRRAIALILIPLLLALLLAWWAYQQISQRQQNLETIAAAAEIQAPEAGAVSAEAVVTKFQGLTSDLSTRNRELDETKGKLSASNTTNAQLNDQIGKLTADNKNLSDELSAAKTSVSSLEDRLKDLTAQRERLSTSLRQVRAEQAASLAAQEASTKQSLTAVDEEPLFQQAATAGPRQASLNPQTKKSPQERLVSDTSMRDELDRLAAALSNAHGQLQASRRQTTGDSTRQATLEPSENRTPLPQDSKTLASTPREEFRLQISSALNQPDMVDATVVSVGDELTTLRQQHSSLREQHIDQSYELETQRTTVSALREMLEEQNDSLARYHSLNAALSSQLARLQGQYRTVQDKSARDAARVKTELDAKSQELAAVQDSLAQAKTELRAMKAKLEIQQ